MNLRQKIQSKDIHEVHWVQQERLCRFLNNGWESCIKRKLIRPIFAQDLLCFTTFLRKIVTLPLLSHKTYRDQGIKILPKNQSFCT